MNPTSDAMENLISPQQAFHKGKMEKFLFHEEKHLQSPSVWPLSLAMLMSIIEGGFAFWLLLESGFIIALTGAAFPVVLIWAMAYCHASFVELPQKLTALQEEYQELIQPDSPEIEIIIDATDTLPAIPVISDQREYEERQADGWVSWLDSDDPSNPIKTAQMLEAHVDMVFFRDRLDELEAERDFTLNYLLNYYREQQKKVAPSNLQSAPRPKHQIQQLMQIETEVETEELRAERDEVLSLTEGRYGTVMNQAKRRFEEAEQRFFTARQSSLEPN